MYTKYLQGDTMEASTLCMDGNVTRHNFGSIETDTCVASGR